MKKETLILAGLISFTVGFITGSILAILKGAKEVETDVAPSKYQSPISTAPPSIEFTEKIEDLKEILRNDPKNLSAWLKLGKLYSDFGLTRDAIDAYNRYLTLQPDNPDVRTDLGIMLRRLGDFDGAIEEFQKAARSDPKHSNCRYHLGIILLHDKRDVKEAIRAWEDFLKVAPEGERVRRVRVQMERLKNVAK
jgi:cytochrome c-type biogenesis protein CcmH/NrfG